MTRRTRHQRRRPSDRSPAQWSWTPDHCKSGKTHPPMTAQTHIHDTLQRLTSTCASTRLYVCNEAGYLHSALTEDKLKLINKIQWHCARESRGANAPPNCRLSKIFLAGEFYSKNTKLGLEFWNFEAKFWNFEAKLKFWGSIISSVGNLQMSVKKLPLLAHPLLSLTHDATAEIKYLTDIYTTIYM